MDHNSSEAANLVFRNSVISHACWLLFLSNGFNIIPPLHDPVPVGPVVPQFYGYYVPEEEEKRKKFDDEDEIYLSPILLLEDCGTPVKPNQLSIDDRQEAASLYYRFHHAGWIHGSVFPRNILSQTKLNTYPAFSNFPELDGDAKRQKSFRLIDFGWSYIDEKKSPQARAKEEEGVGKMFRVHVGGYM
jgi:hypothetical protein